ncbi:FAD-dependent oxidoreductase [Paenibacillus koleovorans]|uniref:FAD-dependent oxidoreductase n=1 Tax=Paenibacillus koleovorans TaxID=121608 RepID=UPI000FDA1A1B|nr:FAD-dependent oxidoreductase [Paenibacillus koleovorans]
MILVEEPRRSLPVIADVDVLVCGGGPAGFIAAIAAARSGARTLLLERYGFLGGMATVSLVGPISKFRCQGELIVGGIPWEFVERLAARDGALLDLPSGNVPFDPELYKLVAMQMVRESGVELLHHAYAVGCIKDAADEGRLTHVLIESKSGRQAIAAKMIVDCTGDADIVEFAGLPYERSNTDQGETQPMTLYFRMGGADTETMERLVMSHDHVRYTIQHLKEAMGKARSEGKLPLFGGPWIQHGSTIRQGELSANVTRYPGNAVDVRSLTEAECTTRQNMFDLIPFLKESMPELKNGHLICSGTQVGVRESRRIIGLFKMTKEEILHRVDFPDTVAKGAHPIDIHSAKDNSQEVVFINEAYNIPYRSLIPLGSRNVLVAGRCISASREAFGSIRVQAQCMALGQAAGTAAAMCSSEGIEAAELDGVALNRRLLEQGAIV